VRRNLAVTYPGANVDDGHTERPESLVVGALLAGVGGYLDAYTFVGHRVFANAQTGNVVLLGIDAASSHWRTALLRLAPIAAFVVGVLAVEVLESVRRRPPFTVRSASH
jgi:uncharacterized membrane protein YoaK (UPF0700 family)